jgi:cytochrome c553
MTGTPPQRLGSRLGFRGGCPRRRLHIALAWALVAALVPNKAAAAGDPSVGKQKAQQCAVCHGIDGVATVPDAPNIAGESPIYLTKQLEAFRSGERRHEQMSIIAEHLSDEDIADLAAWYASIRFEVRMPQ